MSGKIGFRLDKPPVAPKIERSVLRETICKAMSSTTGISFHNDSDLFSIWSPTMKAISVVTFALVLSISQVKTTRSEDPAAVKSITLRYRLPNQSELMGKTTAAKWNLAAPVTDGISDPNRIVYDQVLRQVNHSSTCWQSD